MNKSNRIFALLALSSALLFTTSVVVAQSPPVSGQNSGSSASSQTLIDPGVIYNDTQPTRWVGKSVTLKNVTVQDTNNTGNFWVGSDGDHRLLVVKQQSNPNLAAIRLHKGDIISVSGVVRPASDYLATKTSAEKGSMNDAKDSSGVFLMAGNVNVVSSTQH